MGYVNTYRSPGLGRTGLGYLPLVPPGGGLPEPPPTEPPSPTMPTGLLEPDEPLPETTQGEPTNEPVIPDEPVIVTESLPTDPPTMIHPPSEAINPPLIFPMRPPDIPQPKMTFAEAELPPPVVTDVPDQRSGQNDLLIATPWPGEDQPSIPPPTLIHPPPSTDPVTLVRGQDPGTVGVDEHGAASTGQEFSIAQARSGVPLEDTEIGVSIAQGELVKEPPTFVEAGLAEESPWLKWALLGLGAYILLQSFQTTRAAGGFGRRR